MKTFSVCTILWVVSFLVKHGQPASLHFPPNLHFNASNDFMTKPKAGQLEATADVKEIRVKRNAIKVTSTGASKTPPTADIPINAQSLNTQSLNAYKVTSPSAISTNGDRLSNATDETPSAIATENVTQSDTEETTSVSTFENTTVTDSPVNTTSANSTEESTATTQYSSTEETITVTTTKAGLTEPCTYDDECKTESAFCSNGYCACKEEYFRAGQECKKKAGLTEPCIHDGACKTESAFCSNGSCACKEEYFRAGQECKKKAGLTEPCTYDDECKTESAFCSSGSCACKEEYFRAGQECKKRKKFGAECDKEECLDRKAHCNEEKKKCLCFDVYFRKNNVCIDKKRFSEVCEENDLCFDRNAFCSTETRRCVCSDDYKLKENKCVKIVLPYWWLVIIIIILILVILVFLYLLIRHFKPTAGNVTFMKLKSLKTLSHKRPYKIRSFLQIDSKTFIQDYKIIGKVSPLILNAESDLTSNDTYLPCHEAQKTANKKKNRFLNVLPFDRSRVKLDVIDDDPFTDYINANYINGYNQEKEYIACQGPLIHTVDDFWRMVWQENINLIVMLTLCEENGKHKCYPYWPKNEKLKVISRDLLLETDVVINNEYYNESNILVNMDEETRIVKHLHFQKWPDFSATVDPTVLINFVKIIRSHFTQAPILIHCSAGVGRTGTLIAVDYMMQYVRDHTLDDAIDVFSFVYKMRESRPQMVQNQDQYALINTCIKKAIMDKFNLKYIPQVNKDEDNKKNEVRVDVEEAEDSEKETETDEDDSDEDVENLTDKVEENLTDKVEEPTKETTGKVEENVAAINTNKVENAKIDINEDAKDGGGENADEVTGDTGEDKDANSNVYTNECEADVDERVPLTQETSEL